MKRYTWRTALLEAVMIGAGLLFAFPVYVLVVLALRSEDSTASPLAPPTEPTLANFGDAWREAGLGAATLYSALVTVSSVTLLVVLSALAAYPIARSTRHWSRGVFALFMLGLLLPFQLALIPLYQTMRDLGLLGNPLALTIFYTGVQMPFSVFLYTGFLRTLDRGYEEAALMDGCGPVRAFVRVVFPLLRPITGTVVILNVIFVWNDFLTPLLYLSGTGQQTIPVALFGFVGQYVSQWPLVFAGLIIGSAPVLIAYFAMQKRIIQGFAGGLKG
ncbi:carbohydrate ABC transporter permease [Thermobifida halotolerans]|uniref:Carbohydrate ABC transporter permease n=1 Tax=Thermobifida halotolerans TaxID=483545 RepID=A0A399G635_9ACTN|nr:carbohydrate ABC transporter permease [Thermobifida halotolerans]UOE21166.1 carbohydrate ABC transporter permease [Thermobifida halotolerans]